jgi:hypothetical protein
MAYLEADDDELVKRKLFWYTKLQLSLITASCAQLSRGKPQNYMLLVSFI